MISKEVPVTNELGFHARPASLLIRTAKKYNCSFTLAKAGQSTALGSLTALMKLRVKHGDVVTISADGPDEETGLAGLVALIENRFGEK